MKKIFLILILFNVLIQAKGITAESCIGYTDKTISSDKKNDKIINLQALCSDGCGKACVEASIIRKRADNIIYLEDLSLKEGCNAKFPYAKSCYMRRLTDESNKKIYLEKSCNLGYVQGCNDLSIYAYNNKDRTQYIESLKKACSLGDGNSCSDLVGIFANVKFNRKKN